MFKHLSVFHSRVFVDVCGFWFSGFVVAHLCMCGSFVVFGCLWLFE